MRVLAIGIYIFKAIYNPQIQLVKVLIDVEYAGNRY